MKFKKLAIVLVIFLILLGAAVLIFRLFRSEKSKITGSTASSDKAQKIDLFGTMLAYNVNDGLMDLKISDKLESGWSVFKKNPQILEKYLNSLQKLYDDRDELIKKTDFSSDREIAGLFTWGVIEPEKGKFDWTLTDLAAEHAKSAKIKLSAVIQPFAGWDQKNTQVDSACQALDFAWYDYKSGPPNDWAEYKNFLEATVKRYKDAVSDWEIGNEYDGQCGGYQDNPEGYVKLLKISYDTIKEADPKAKVLNGGALEFLDNSIRNFWRKFFQLGGGNYLDAFNLHYNKERNGAKDGPAEFLEVLSFYNNLMKSQNLAKPLWLTEFGTYSGTPRQPPGQSSSASAPKFSTQSQEFQAAWYFRYSILAFANNTEKIFIDLAGPDDQNIGASSIYNLQGESRLFIKTLQAIAVEIKDFSKVEKIAGGQYKFTVGIKNIYAFWSGDLPSEIKGTVKVTDLYGAKKSMDAQSIKFSSQEPILVEF